MEPDDLTIPRPSDYFLKFHGKGSTYFGIVAINIVLTIVTLGLYYPWAKERYRKYIWNETEFQNTRFIFHGTGKEMFRGFLIAYVFMIVFYGCYFALTSSTSFEPVLIGAMFLVSFISALVLIPFAIFSSWRYRVSRTSWRGIYFSFSGKFSEYFPLYFKYLLLTIVTFGFGFTWFKTNIQKYLVAHTHLGNFDMDFHGEGSELLGINILGSMLSYMTLGIYYPFFLANRYNFTVNNTTVSDRTIRRTMRSSLTGSHLLGVLFVNLVLLICTLGLAFPFTKMRYLQALIDNTQFPEDLDYDAIEQDATFYNKAAGEELLDILDVDIDF